MGKRETPIQQEVMRELGHGDTRVFRNNVGVLQDERGNFVRYGLCPGSSDLIGWRTITIQPTDVGRRLAVFLAVECKTARGRERDNQVTFRQAVTKAGGIAIVARSAADARQGVDTALDPE